MYMQLKCAVNFLARIDEMKRAGEAKKRAQFRELKENMERDLKVNTSLCIFFECSQKFPSFAYQFGKKSSKPNLISFI